VVESTALEMRHTGNRIVGSNPTLSATQFPSPALNQDSPREPARNCGILAAQRVSWR
jgi:hypothetical protein